MLSRKELLEDIKVGDRICYSDYDLNISSYVIVEGMVAETRVRCGEQGDIMEDYLILEDGTEVDYANVGWVIKNERL